MVLDDPTFAVRAAAVISFRKIGDRRAAQPLARRLGKATEDAGIVILLTAPPHIGGRRAREDAERIAGNPNPRERRTLSRVVT